jgi:DNA repair exonuclease SbcCD nuclease subunit
MNAMVQMPDHGELQAAHFKHQDYVFSGHFHKRQARDKIVYIGNAFPHNYADSCDDDRGMMTMEWGGTPEYFKWEDAPKYRVVTLSKLIDEKDDIMLSKMYLKVHLDIDITYEEANFIKETYIQEHDIRDISLIQEKNNIETGVDDNPDASFESVDQIVTEQLLNIESDTISSKTLLEIYNNL